MRASACSHIVMCCALRSDVAARHTRVNPSRMISTHRAQGIAETNRLTQSCPKADVDARIASRRFRDVSLAGVGSYPFALYGLTVILVGAAVRWIFRARLAVHGSMQIS